MDVEHALSRLSFVSITLDERLNHVAMLVDKQVGLGGPRWEGSVCNTHAWLAKHAPDSIGEKGILCGITGMSHLFLPAYPLACCLIAERRPATIVECYM